MKTINKIFVLFFISFSLSAQSNDKLKDFTLDVLKYYRAGQYEEAVVKCQEIDRQISRKNLVALMDNYVIWASSLLATKKYEASIQIALLARDISKYDYRIIQILGEAYYFNRNELEALDYLQQYVAISTVGDQVARSYYYMGEIYIGQGLYNHANIAISTAVYHNARNGKWWYRLGYAREMIEDTIGARTAYTKAIELNPNLTEIRNRLATLPNI